MIELTRLGTAREPFWLNPDLIAMIEAHPDTVVSLTTGTKVMVLEPVDEVVARIRAWRVSVARAALGGPVNSGASGPTTRVA
jgi:flagellar protein FlbD